MARDFDIGRIAKTLRHLAHSLPKDTVSLAATGITDADREPLTKLLRKSARAMNLAADLLDPVSQPVGRIELFSPHTIGRLIGQELTTVPRIPLAQLQPFHGSGIYAIYYTGPHPAYEAISNTNCPIYAGVAHPKVRTAASPTEQGRKLYERLDKHRANILLARQSIDIAHFDCRYLVTESGWQATAEEFLIWLYQPVWNKEMKVCSGFGKHGDVARKEWSRWDMLHPGRPWAKGQTSRDNKVSPKTIITDINHHYEKLFATDPAFWSDKLNPAWLRRHAGT